MNWLLFGFSVNVLEPIYNLLRCTGAILQSEYRKFIDILLWHKIEVFWGIYAKIHAVHGEEYFAEFLKQLFSVSLTRSLIWDKLHDEAPV
jgi:hypothetical protein